MAFQSTHPCGVRLGHTVDSIKSFVSIHAPVWGATVELKKAIENYSFNPRTRVGCDHWKKLGYASLQVSIHAPVWGATSKLLRLVSMACFNPRTRVGCDSLKQCKTTSQMFQSTHPCGVRHVSFMMQKPSLMFQSTHPCGVRPYFNHSTSIP